MLRRLTLTFALALVFGLGQMGAAVHEISHYADLSPASQKQKQDQAPHSDVCGQCLSYSNLANALSVSYFIPPTLAVGFEAIVFNASNHQSPTLTSYSARAPPQLA
jgi:hypothetical protein